MSDDGRHERGRDVEDALSQRFESDTTAENVETDESENGDTNETPDESSKNDVNSDTSTATASGDEADESSKNDVSGRSVTNVKEEWPSRMFYLPGGVAGRLDSEYDRLVYECGQELDWTPKKSRHYYPVIARDGLDAVAEMGPEEFQARVEGLSLAGRERERGGG